MIRIAIPKGSLEEGVFRLFDQADLPIKRSNKRDYALHIDDPRIKETLMLRPQEISTYVEDGEFELGITGFDWIVENQSNVQEVSDLRFSKTGWRKVKIVLATDVANPVSSVEEIKPNSRVVTEYPRLTKRFFKNAGKGRVSVRGSHGATEIKVPRLADYLVDVTETGETLTRNNKKILATLLESTTKLIANKSAWEDPKLRKEIEEVASLLGGVVNSQGKTLIKMNVEQKQVDALIEELPVLRPPTISPFYSKHNGYERESWVMVETVVDKSSLNLLLPRLKELGAKDILELDVSKMMP